MQLEYQSTTCRLVVFDQLVSDGCLGVFRRGEEEEEEEEEEEVDSTKSGVLEAATKQHDTNQFTGRCKTKRRAGVLDGLPSGKCQGAKGRKAVEF